MTDSKGDIPQGPKSSASEPKAPKRHFFTIERDILLLNLTIQHNPQQLGTGKWVDIVKAYNDKEGSTVDEKTLRARERLLRKQYEDQSLTTRTGTEEERSKRGELIEESISMYHQAKANINTMIGPGDGLDENSKNDDDDEASNHDPEEKVSKAKEIREADAERDKALKEMGAMGPSPPIKKKRMTPEESLLQTHTAHEMEMDKKRLKFQEEEQKMKYELEKQRMELEKSKEARLGREADNRDAFLQSQMEMTKMMMEILRKQANM